jgi:Cu(I)/Ag(I) efflux system protein CusF
MLNSEETFTPNGMPTSICPWKACRSTIKVINSKKHSVTIAHVAVPTVQWPAMTMAFNAITQQLAGLKAGDRAAFEFRAEGMAATIVSIKTLK